MRKTILLLIVLCLCVGLCACSGSEETFPVTEPAVTAVPTEAVTQPTVQPTEAAAVPTTQPPRILGPESIEGNAVTIQNVSVEFLDALPASITSSSAYSSSGNKEDFVLNESQVYSVITFTITNQTAKEIEIADIHDNFMVELIYDNTYVYSTDSESAAFFKSGSQSANVRSSSSIGKVTLSPLTTADVAVYIPCAREVSTNTDNYLIVSFLSAYSGYETFEFIIR